MNGSAILARVSLAVATFFAGSFVICFAQAPESETTKGLPEHELQVLMLFEEDANKPPIIDKNISKSEGGIKEDGPLTETHKEQGQSLRQNGWYVRPEPKVRFRRYISSVAGPVAIVRYTAVAGVLTYRNAPKEWGGNWEGFGRRFLSNMGESAIKNSIKYGLDEALKIDSWFYLSPNRSPSARARNAVFSAVTARDRNGRRVFGLPKLAGHLVSNVTSAEVWYPRRYDYVHGLKGAAISLAVDAGINLFREFVIKR